MSCFSSHTVPGPHRAVGQKSEGGTHLFSPHRTVPAAHRAVGQKSEGASFLSSRSPQAVASVANAIARMAFLVVISSPQLPVAIAADVRPCEDRGSRRYRIFRGPSLPFEREDTPEPAGMSSIRVRGLDRGIFGPFLGPRRYVSGRFGVSGERGPRGRSAQGLSRMDAGIGGDQTSWNPSKALAVARGGARAGKPRWVSNRVRCQAILGFQGVLDLSMAFMMLSSLCMQATVHAIPTASLPPIPPIPPPAGPPQDRWGKPFDYAQGRAGSNVCGAPPNRRSSLPHGGVDQEEGVNPNTGQNDDIVVSQNNDQVKFIIQSQGSPCL